MDKDIQNLMAEVLAPIAKQMAEIQKRNAEVLAPIAKQMAEIQKRNAEVLAPFIQNTNFLKKLLPNIVPNIEIISKAYECIKKERLDYIQNRYPKIKEANNILVKEGWYFEPELCDINLSEIKKIIENNNFKDLETFLIEVLEDNIDSIEEYLCDRFGDRKIYLKNMFDSYKEEKYSLCFPSLFCILEGSIKSEIDKQLFSYKNGYKNEIESLSKKTEGYIVSPFTLHLLDYERISDLRNRVMHGNPEHYTKINILKVISFYYYIAKVLDIKELMKKSFPKSKFYENI